MTLVCRMAWAVVLGLACVSPLMAGVMADRTRVIFPQGETTQSLTLVNTNAYDVLVQLWVDDGAPEGVKQDSNAPFLAMAPVFRLAASEIKSIRLIYNNKPQPSDREALYWLNIYEVPNIPITTYREKSLMMSMKTQMKVIYRPKKLEVNNDKPIDKISCRLLMGSATPGIECANPTGYYISLRSITVHHNKQRYKGLSELDMMIEPFSHNQFRLVAESQTPVSRSEVIELNFINDYGNITRRIVKQYDYTQEKHQE